METGNSLRRDGVGVPLFIGEESGDGGAEDLDTPGEETRKGDLNVALLDRPAAFIISDERELGIDLFIPTKLIPTKGDRVGLY